MSTAKRTATFTESVIREMTRIATEVGALNLAQGFPDFAMPQAMKDAACAAIQGTSTSTPSRGARRRCGSPSRRSTAAGTTSRSIPTRT